MNSSVVVAIQQIISSAVTPVVLISACATLILVINTKHTNVSDRLRGIASEYRLPQLTPLRRQQLLDQTKVFHRRFALIYAAHVALNAASICFILMVPILLFTERHKILSNIPTLLLFLTGIFLMLLAMCFELAEIALSTQSIQIEIRDIVPLPQETATVHPAGE